MMLIMMIVVMMMTDDNDGNGRSFLDQDLARYITAM
jgi:hypothetical protein